MTTDHQKRFSLRIRDMRVARKLTQAALAHAAGVTTEVIARIERAQRRGRSSACCNPTLDTIVRLATAFNVAPGELLK